MAYIPQNGGTVDLTLASAVTNGNTFTTSYPTGFVQDDFTAGLSDYGVNHMIVNGADKVLEGSGGIALSFGSSTITVTNNTGATLAAGTTVKMYYASRRGNNVMTIQVPIYLAGVSAADVVSALRPGVDGYIENLEWIQGRPVTTGSKLATLSAKINSTVVTGGAVALTSALCTPLGARVAGSQVTAANRITKKDSLTIVAASVTTFVEGDGFLNIRIRLDTL